MSFKDNFLAIVIFSLIISGIFMVLWFYSYVQPEMTDLRNQLDQANQQIASQTPNTTTERPTDVSVRVNYLPKTLFNLEERQKVADKFILPMQAFYNEDEIKMHSVLVEQNSVTALLDDGTVEYSIDLADGVLWIPICDGECVFTNSFYALYPEIVNGYERVN